MKLIIAGGRNYIFSSGDYIRLNKEFAGKIEEEVCGDARGADTYGAVWAESLGIPVIHFPADWNGLGKSAGYIRNVRMADYADAVVLFPGGRGTEHMFNIAKQKDLKIYDWRSSVKSRCINPTDHSPYPNDPGACCCNCKSQRKVVKPSNELIGYGCTIFVDMEKNRKEDNPIVILNEHGYCECFKERY